MEMVKRGGHFIGVTTLNNFCGHGFYQFSPELYYRVFAPGNGFEVVKMYVCEVAPRLRNRFGSRSPTRPRSASG